MLIALIADTHLPRHRRRLPDGCIELLRRSDLIVHDAGPRRARLARLRGRFPQVDAVVFGHSHVPLHECAEGGFQIFNPGSPTERRRAPSHTMGVARVAGGRIAFELVEL